MKKLPLIGIIALMSVGLMACTPSSPAISDSSSIASDVQEVIITGSRNVMVGRTIRLSASTEVTWTSLNTDIATVDASGVVTGVSVGTATIRATSTINPSVSADWEVSVSPVVPDSINITIEGEGLISQEGDVYNLSMGKSVVASIDSDPSFNTSYTLSYSDQNYSGSIDVENISNTSIRLTPNRVVSGVTLVYKILYGTDLSSSKQDTVTLNVIDPNSEILASVEERLSATANDERSALTKATISKTVKLGEEVLSKDELKYSSFSDATYLAETDEDSNSTHYFSGIRDDHYYLFSYDPSDDNAIGNIYQSVVGTDASYASYMENAKMLFDPSGSISYGLGSMIANLFDGSRTLSYSFVTFGDTTAYNNMTIVSGDSEIVASSSFSKDGSEYTLSLTVGISENRFNSYSFSETYTSDEGTYSYEEALGDLTYGEKISDTLDNNADYLDFDSYYFKEALQIIDISGTKDADGRYDYSDTSKFGGNVTTDADGNVHYSVPYNKSLPLRVTSSSGGNALIDTVTITPSNSEIDVPSLAAGGIYTFSAKEGEVDGVHTMMEGETTFTFLSGKNQLSKTIVIEFYIPEVTALTVTNNPTDNDFGEVYRGEVSEGYVYLNAEPDDSSLSFEIVDESGTDLLTGIEIYNYPDGNIDGYPSFGYFVKGNVNGTYSFKFRVVGTSVVSEETFTVTVIDPISAATIKENIVDEEVSYVNKTSTTTTTAKFISETVMTLSYVSTGVDEITKNVAYHIEEGHIVIDSASDGSNYAFGDASFYYQKIMAGNIKFERDFSAITLYLSYETETTEDKFMPVVLTKDRTAEINYDDISSYLNGKTFIGNSAWLSDTSLAGMYTPSVTYTATSGVLTLTKNADGSQITFSFDYSYDATYKSLTYSNCVSSVESLSLDGSYSSNLRSSDNTLNFRIYSGTIASAFSVPLLG